MSTLFPALAVPLAALCVWLTVGIINRREKWAICSAVAIILPFMCLPLLQSRQWCGRATRTLKFAVLDSKSGNPIPNASITVFHGISDPGLGVAPAEPDGSDSRTQHLSSDSAGNAKAQHEFFAYGHDNWFTDVGHVVIGNRFIRVAAIGYDPIQFSLRDAVGDQKDHHDKTPITVCVKLVRHE